MSRAPYQGWCFDPQDVFSQSHNDTSKKDSAPNTALVFLRDNRLAGLVNPTRIAESGSVSCDVVKHRAAEQARQSHRSSVSRGDSPEGAAAAYHSAGGRVYNRLSDVLRVALLVTGCCA